MKFVINQSKFENTTDPGVRLYNPSEKMGFGPPIRVEDGDIIGVTKQNSPGNMLGTLWHSNLAPPQSTPLTDDVAIFSKYKMRISWYFMGFPLPDFTTKG